jgi:hypothetical protein
LAGVFCAAAVRRGLGSCGKSSRCSAAIARIATTRQQRTRRSTPSAWRRRSFAIRAANTRRTRKLSNDPARVVIPSEALGLGKGEGSGWAKHGLGFVTCCDAERVFFMSALRWIWRNRFGSTTGAKFTALRRPVELIWWQSFSDQNGAQQREARLKGWRREKKLELRVGFGDRIYPSAAKTAASG